MHLHQMRRRRRSNQKAEENEGRVALILHISYRISNTRLYMELYIVRGRTQNIILDIV